jgi:KDO2-lipid IV(A) lauroyltransferase
MSTERKPLWHYWTPNYWSVWLGLGLLRLLCLLPIPVGLAIGRGFGRLAHRLGGKRRAIVRRNIELCFPDLSPAERDEMAFAHFKALGMALIEHGLGRWASDRRLLKITTIEGLEHLQAAVETGKGIILLGAHFTTLEISGRVFALNSPPLDVIYRKNRSDFMTEVIRSGRERSVDGTIEKRDIKEMVNRLRKGRTIWYAPDQSYNRKGSVVVPFFGVPTMHTTATSTLARLGKATTLFYFSRRTPDGQYILSVLPQLENFPGDDPVEDTKRYIAVLEDYVRLCPEQYFWIHRKFKDLPDEYPDLYSDLDALK